MSKEELKKLMLDKKWSMEDVAKHAFVTRHAVKSWLRPASSRAHRQMNAQSEALLRVASKQ